MTTKNTQHTLTLQGEQLIDLDKYQLAEKKFREALSLNPMNQTARLGYCRTLLLLKKHHELRQELDECIKLFPDNPQFLFLTFGMYFDRENYILAIQTGKEYLKQRPEDVRIHALMAQAYLFEGKHIKQAEAHVQEALRINPASMGAHEAHGLLLTEKKQYSAAIKVFQDMLKHDPNDTSAHVYLSNVYYRDGQRKEAQNSLRTALQLDPNNQSVLDKYLELKSTSNPLLYLLYKWRIFLHKLHPGLRTAIIVLLIFSRIGTIVGIVVLILLALEHITIYALKKEWIK